ncbi:LysR family transcriptional regulator [Cupriavidus sp. 2TAF22]|uniref:LysR family transcriptional regulator n=1 Tax=unclassified Cupriavidus TaxID=2640874 RepID=UPI003F928CAF
MDIRQLRTFVTVARLASVTRAAEALHITQPAVSGQLRQLEEDLGVRLLSRSTSSVTLTQSGQELLGRAESAIEAFGNFVNAAKGLRGQIEGHLRVGVVMLDPAMLRIGPFMQHMVTQYPGLKIDLQVGRTPWLRAALQSSEIDAAILVARTTPRGARALLLKSLSFCLVAPPSWGARLGGADAQELARLPWLRMTPDSAHQEMMAEICAQAGIHPAGTVEADHEALIGALVAAGVGIGLLRDELAQRAEAAGEAIRLSGYERDTRLCLLYQEAREQDPAIIAMRDALRDVWALDA